MAEKLVMKFGKSMIKKKAAGKASGGSSEDPYFYLKEKLDRHNKPTGKFKSVLKDAKYYMGLGIPEHDAIILAKVKKQARRLDNWLDIGVTHVGLTSLIELIPVIGDGVGGVLALAIIKQCDGVTGGMPNVYRAKMMSNLVIDVLVGLTPVLGDIVDTLFRCNTRNGNLLEKMLLERVKHAANETTASDKPARNAVSNNAISAGKDAHHPQPNHPPTYDTDAHGQAFGNEKGRHNTGINLVGGKTGNGWFRNRKPSGQREDRHDKPLPAQPPRPVS